ncbi:DNA polymerase III subunit delta [Lacticaseibacillus baoqingensis]|uniref:DNA polymerase III subunit delta n=1 Tax=Lacticaseibacillus baoqingensis TaxID=2486013 RepID=A0ABW4E736_9LACO|nr:DNA polymerase III subunit delta [Lacticaseibacillus baoqingensis]
MQITEFLKQLKQQVPPLILILGEEEAVREQALSAIKAVIPEAEATMNLATYDMRQTPVAVALDDAASPPFFGDRREVVIQDPYFLTGETKLSKIEHDLDALTAYFKAPIESTVMVLVAPYPKLDERKRLTKALKQNACVVEAKPLDERQAKHAVQAALQKQNIAVTADGLQALATRANADYSVMMAQLPKLALYAANGSVLDAEAISALVPKQLTDRVFDLVSAVLARDVTTALGIYRDLLLQKEEPIRLNSLLLGQFRLLLQVQILAKKGYSQGSVASTLKVHPYRVKLAWRQSGRLNGQALRQAYIGLVDTEANMKTGKIDKALAFELFVLQYARSATA